MTHIHYPASTFTMPRMRSQDWVVNPARFLFGLSRYKFVAQMMRDRFTLEIGCGDGFYTHIVHRTTHVMHAIDTDADLINDAQTYAAHHQARYEYPIHFRQHDILTQPYPGVFDGIYSLDVLEHIPQEQEDLFITNSVYGLSKDGIAIFGMPSKESQPYASELSKQGHVNCKTEHELRKLMQRHFGIVLIFGMNDEVLHTGFGPMCHYRFAVCANKKGKS